MFRVSLTLPQDLARVLNSTAQGLGVSQSALVAYLLEDPLNRLGQMFADRPVGDLSAVLRSRGASAADVRQRIADALANAPPPHPDLFP